MLWETSSESTDRAGILHEPPLYDAVVFLEPAVVCVVALEVRIEYPRHGAHVADAGLLLRHDEQARHLGLLAFAGAIGAQVLLLLVTGGNRR
jgi:hypothetical protein